MTKQLKRYPIFYALISIGSSQVLFSSNHGLRQLKKNKRWDDLIEIGAHKIGQLFSNFKDFEAFSVLFKDSWTTFGILSSSSEVLVIGCLGGICTSYPVDPSVAHLQHYRSDCVSTLKKSCEKDFKNASVIDTTIWKFNEPLIKASTEALSTLGFFKSTMQRP